MLLKSNKMKLICGQLYELWYIDQEEPLVYTAGLHPYEQCKLLCPAIQSNSEGPLKISRVIREDMETFIVYHY